MAYTPSERKKQTEDMCIPLKNQEGNPVRIDVHTNIYIHTVFLGVALQSCPWDRPP